MFFKLRNWVCTEHKKCVRNNGKNKPKGVMSRDFLTLLKYFREKSLPESALIFELFKHCSMQVCSQGCVKLGMCVAHW